MKKNINNPVKLKCASCGDPIDGYDYKGIIEKPYHRWCWLVRKESVLAELRLRKDRDGIKQDNPGEKKDKVSQ